MTTSATAIRKGALIKAEGDRVLTCDVCHQAKKRSAATAIIAYGMSARYPSIPVNPVLSHAMNFLPFRPREANLREYQTRYANDTTNHIRDIRFDGTVHNNKMERMNGEVRDREKVMRGLKNLDSPILKGIEVFHNYIRPHMGLDGKTPAEAAGIQVKGDNKWLTIIQNASHPPKVYMTKTGGIHRRLDSTGACAPEIRPGRHDIWGRTRPGSSPSARGKGSGALARSGRHDIWGRTRPGSSPSARGKGSGALARSGREPNAPGCPLARQSPVPPETRQSARDPAGYAAIRIEAGPEGGSAACTGWFRAPRATCGSAERAWSRGRRRTG
jgi:hypothetical protein